jgi:DNA-directed RNA polymerase subunit RPC12/RpoP
MNEEIEYKCAWCKKEIRITFGDAFVKQVKCKKCKKINSLGLEIKLTKLYAQK